jgi:hypothetical protein
MLLKGMLWKLLLLLLQLLVSMAAAAGGCQALCATARRGAQPVGVHSVKGKKPCYVTSN